MQARGIRAAVTRRRIAGGRTLGAVLVGLAMLAISETPAGASFWLECRVEAAVAEHLAPGRYVIDVRTATVTCGHAAAGAPCSRVPRGETVEIATHASLPVDRPVTLRYRYADGLGPGYVAVNEHWARWPGRADPSDCTD